MKIQLIALPIIFFCFSGLASEGVEIDNNSKQRVQFQKIKTVNDLINSSKNLLNKADKIFLENQLKESSKLQLAVETQSKRSTIKFQKSLVSVGNLRFDSNDRLVSTVNDHIVFLSGHKTAAALFSEVRSYLPAYKSSYSLFEDKAFAWSISDAWSGIVTSYQLSRREHEVCDVIGYAFAGCEDPNLGYTYAIFAQERKLISTPMSLKPEELNIVKAMGIRIINQLSSGELQESSCRDQETKLKNCAKKFLSDPFSVKYLTAASHNYLEIAQTKMENDKSPTTESKKITQ